MKVAPAINGRWHADRLDHRSTTSTSASAPRSATRAGRAGGARLRAALSLEGDRRRPRRAGRRPRRQADRRGRVGRQLHHLQPRRVGLAARRADHPSPAAGGDPRRRQAREARGGARGGRRRTRSRSGRWPMSPHHRPPRRRRAPDQRLAHPLRRDPGELAINQEAVEQAEKGPAERRTDRKLPTWTRTSASASMTSSARRRDLQPRKQAQPASTASGGNGALIGLGLTLATAGAAAFFFAKAKAADDCRTGLCSATRPIMCCAARR
jgi:hypothetical protein